MTRSVEWQIVDNTGWIHGHLQGESLEAEAHRSLELARQREDRMNDLHRTFRLERRSVHYGDWSTVDE